LAVAATGCASVGLGIGFFSFLHSRLAGVKLTEFYPVRRHIDTSFNMHFMIAIAL